MYPVNLKDPSQKTLEAKRLTPAEKCEGMDLNGFWF